MIGPNDWRIVLAADRHSEQALGTQLELRNIRFVSVEAEELERLSQRCKTQVAWAAELFFPRVCRRRLLQTILEQVPGRFDWLLELTCQPTIVLRPISTASSGDHGLLWESFEHDLLDDRQCEPSPPRREDSRAASPARPSQLRT
jgi:hypothetical protein